MSTLYQQDYNLWIEKTIKLIQEKNFNAVDWENLTEELDSLGKSDKRELRNRLIVLLEHLLKLAYWDSERENNQRGWRTTIREQRRQIKVLLDDSPSLKPFLKGILAECYLIAREEVIEKTGLLSSVFPMESPFIADNTLNSDYFGQN
ncbi:DUF29 domain-containing protein [Chroococcus sp. FPU101]|uniref:DUF29 domain-containing protein n=1 Tax=Chroococcus sp. FPU101 TaxID=1974212 RepID=UPI001A8E61D1|nr:DUF29 domain-containing protein [Chroococcus sp. FPU101]GFE70663.1 protein of unknown function DUF29 [Chroococcus sp. FPU101]